MDTRTEFSRKVIKLIRSIPRGKVASYGQIARLAGKPNGSRGVSWILHSSSRAESLPWQRVVNSQGRISFPEESRQFSRQKSLLEMEGVIFENGKISEGCFWKKAARESSRRRPTKKSNRYKL